MSFIVLSMVLINTNVFSQKDTKQKSDSIKYKYSIGAGAGFTTGSGLSFRYIPKKLGFQVNFAPIQTEYSDIYSAGITAINYLLENEKTNLYLYWGNSYYYMKEKYFDYSTPTPIKTDSVHVTEHFNTGVGVGIELILLKRISMNFMAGYALKENFKKFNFTGEGGIYYKF